MGSVLFGAALVYTGGAPHGEAAAGFQWIGAGNIAGIPVSMIVWLLIALGVAWLVRRKKARCNRG